MMSPGKRRLGIGLLGVALLAVPTIAQATPIRHQLQSLGVMPSVASFTEVYFETPNPIRTAVAPSGATRFTFVVHNRSTSTRVYRAVVSNGVPGHLKRVATTPLTLAGGASMSLPVHTQLADCKVRTQINVEVSDDSGKVESIHFWAVPDQATQSPKTGRVLCAA